MKNLEFNQEKERDWFVIIELIWNKLNINIILPRGKGIKWSPRGSKQSQIEIQCVNYSV